MMQSSSADVWLEEARPTLAVVITSYNYGRFLRQTLDSILSQVPPYDEVVVVDDGSTDDSLDVLAEYAGRLLVLAVPNGGHLAACRLGMAQTSSDYIHTMDSDDYVAPGLVARLHAALASAPAKVQFQLRGVDTEGRALSSVFPVYPAGYDAAAMREDNCVLGFYICPPTSANVYSRKALDRLSLSEFEGRSGFDSAPNLAMPYLGEVVSISEPLVSYRVHPASQSGWSTPTQALLAREIRLFEASWREVGAALGMETMPFSSNGPLYLREREMMLACMERKTVVVAAVWRYIVGLSGSHVPAGQKAVLSAWAMVLLVPSLRLRTAAIRLKRSSVNRSRTLQLLINLLKNIRGVGRRATLRVRTAAWLKTGSGLIGSDV